MQTQARISIAALAATAALVAVPASASAAFDAKITVKAPSCSKTSKARVTVSATPYGPTPIVGIFVGFGNLGTPAQVLFGSTSYDTSISGEVPVGKKITAGVMFIDSSRKRTTFTVKKCATKKVTKKPAFTG